MLSLSLLLILQILCNNKSDIIRVKYQALAAISPYLLYAPSVYYNALF